VLRKREKNQQSDETKERPYLSGPACHRRRRP
jgi:hypothetical protein